MKATPHCCFPDRLKARQVAAILAIGLFFGGCPFSWGYSILTHEEVVDIAWKDNIQPLLLKRFPGASAAQLRRAHAFAYGGCLIQDIGYYPFGNELFSGLTHYVRSGDFVVNLIQESADLEQYAFALGALAHYSADTQGHPTVNRVVALTFPKLQAKYGNRVTYAENPTAHIRTEFGFDLVQVAKNRYTSDQYHDFIGFEVSKPVLERAFFKTYGLPLQEVLGHEDLAIGTFRRGVSQVIPAMTRVALVGKRMDLVKETPNRSEREFRYYLSHAQYEKEWGRDYRRPGVFTRILAAGLRWWPKFGPFRAMAIKVPTTQTEDLYIRSVDRTVEHYRGLLRALGSGDLKLPNLDCDTGQAPRVGEYEGSDAAYAGLLKKLSNSKQGLEGLSPDLREDILAFYRNLDVPTPTEKQTKSWFQALKAVNELRAPHHAGSRPEIEQLPPSPAGR